LDVCRCDGLQGVRWFRPNNSVNFSGEIEPTSSQPAVTARRQASDRLYSLARFARAIPATQGPERNDTVKMLFSFSVFSRSLAFSGVALGQGAAVDLTGFTGC